MCTGKGTGNHSIQSNKEKQGSEIGKWLSGILAKFVILYTRKWRSDVMLQVMRSQPLLEKV